MVVRLVSGRTQVRFSVSRLGLVVRRSVGKKRKDAGSVSLLGLSGGKTGKRKDAGSVSRFTLI